jgi:hypothetical protein
MIFPHRSDEIFQARVPQNLADKTAFFGGHAKDGFLLYQSGDE